MKKIPVLAALLLALAFPTLASAQLRETTKPVDFSQLLRQGMTTPQGLIGLIGLDPNRFTMQQSYSLSYMSMGGHGFSEGLYLNTLGYRLADPLQLSVQWGMRHQPLGALGVSSVYQSGFFLSGANLEYKPSDKFSIGIQFSSFPYYYYGPYREVRPGELPPAGER